MTDLTAPSSPPFAGFIVTKQHRRFEEFCDTCRQQRYIGLCHGLPGVGKTLSARQYAGWDQVEPVLPYLGYTMMKDQLAPALAACRTLFYTPPVTNSPKIIDRELRRLWHRLTEIIGHAAAAAGRAAGAGVVDEPARPVDLVIVDEADRLKMQSLEHLRDLYDRGRHGLVLIGMPGIEKRMARYPQLYSRVGFVHHFQPLSDAEVRFILERQWRQAGRVFDPDDFTDAEALAAIIRATGGNFRLLERLLTQVERIRAINGLRTITKEVVEAARESLVVGEV